jgi:zinc transport system permease protein
MVFGLVSVLAGLTLSYYGDLPPGGTIVLLAAGGSVAALLVGSVVRGR